MQCIPNLHLVNFHPFCYLILLSQESAPKKAVAKPANAEELTIDDLSALRDAIDALSQEKGQSFVGEHDVLADIKQELVDYEEDLGELKDVAESSGRKQMKQTKGAARLYKKVIVIRTKNLYIPESISLSQD